MAQTVETTGLLSSEKMVSNPPLGSPEDNLAPCWVRLRKNIENLPLLSSFGNYPSLDAIRSSHNALVIAMDSEWYYDASDTTSSRKMLSWQFSLIFQDELWEFVYLRKNRSDLHLELALGRILEVVGFSSIDIRTIPKQYTSLGDINPQTGEPTEKTFKSAAEALEHSKALYSDKKKYHVILDWSTTRHIPVVLLCHAGKADLTSLDQSSAYSTKILPFCSDVQGGLITLKSFRIYPPSVNPANARNHRTRKYPVRLQISDTMCHSPVGMKSLKDLGRVIGVNKIELPDLAIEKMNVLLDSNPGQYFSYASNDSVITLLYAAALYGYNKTLPATITSAAARVLKAIIAEHLKAPKSKTFELKYRGLKRVDHGLVPKEDKPGYIMSSSLEPISPFADIIQHFASFAYHGGYNSSSIIGYFPNPTWDYDLQNAYPTAMCLVADINWKRPIKREIKNHKLSLDDFHRTADGRYDMTAPMFAYVRFSFPKSVKYPCIPVDVDGVPIYPRTSDGLDLDGVYACGPELYLALQLGAEITVERGYIANCLRDRKAGSHSYSLRAAVKQLVRDRNQAKKNHGKKSLEELILKTMVNSGYGKTAQNVVQKNTWSAYRDIMEDLGCSSITNPVSACMTTSIVRAVLLAAQNQCGELGYMTCSVTTDGFISDVPEDILKSLDLYGIRRYMESARLYLTDNQSGELWEVKHWQDDLVNFTTRGNVSLLPHGVCAHNSTKSGYAPDSYEDRLWLMTQVLSRTGPVAYTTKEWPIFKELVRGEPFAVRTVSRKIRMDYDLKRKPDRQSFQQTFVPLNGEEYEIANFTTVPYETVAEYRKYREVKKSVDCLRTTEDWNRFFDKVTLKGSGLKVRDLDWAILNSCIMGHRARLWNIPKLNVLTGQERTDWINSHNASKKRWKESDWKNAGRSSWQCNMLPQEMLADKLDELILDR